jgi:hypothetical protein
MDSPRLQHATVPHFEKHRQLFGDAEAVEEDTVLIHYIELCTHCGKVISKLRSPGVFTYDTGKWVRYGICDECKRREDMISDRVVVRHPSLHEEKA